MAPLWDFCKGQFVGVLSALDFILILREVCLEIVLLSHWPFFFLFSFFPKKGKSVIWSLQRNTVSILSIAISPMYEHLLSVLTLLLRGRGEDR